MDMSLLKELIGKGKPGKVALTAVMRKLLLYMNHQIKTLAAQEPIQVTDPSQKKIQKK